VPKRFRGDRGLADFETRAVDRAVQSEQCRLDALSAATAGPGIGQAQRVQRAGDELLAAGDQQTVERMRQMGPHLSPEERKAVNRRAVRAGGQAIFTDDGL
jgi:hypothetical protein